MESRTPSVESSYADAGKKERRGTGGQGRLTAAASDGLLHGAGMLARSGSRSPLLPTARDRAVRPPSMQYPTTNVCLLGGL
jgi:hypothetical protein